MSDYLFIFFPSRNLESGEVRVLRFEMLVFPPLSPPITLSLPVPTRGGAFHVIKYSWGTPRSRRTVYWAFSLLLLVGVVLVGCRRFFSFFFIFFFGGEFGGRFLRYDNVCWGRGEALGEGERGW